MDRETYQLEKMLDIKNHTNSFISWVDVLDTKDTKDTNEESWTMHYTKMTNWSHGYTITSNELGTKLWFMIYRMIHEQMFGLR